MRCKDVPTHAVRASAGGRRPAHAQRLRDGRSDSFGCRRYKPASADNGPLVGAPATPQLFWSSNPDADAKQLAQAGCVDRDLFFPPRARSDRIAGVIQPVITPAIRSQASRAGPGSTSDRAGGTKDRDRPISDTASAPNLPVRTGRADIRCKALLCSRTTQIQTRRHRSRGVPQHGTWHATQILFPSVSRKYAP